jgi:hypothetical protein
VITVVARARARRRALERARRETLAIIAMRRGEASLATTVRLLAK